MHSEIKINSSSGPINCIIVGQTEVNGKPFAIVNLGAGAYIKGVYTKFAVVPTHQLLNRNVDDVRVSEDSESD